MKVGKLASWQVITEIMPAKDACASFAFLFIYPLLLILFNAKTPHYT